MLTMRRFLARYGCRIGSHAWMICTRATEDWTDPFKKMVVCRRCGKASRYFMSDEKYIATCVTIGIVVGLSVLLAGINRGCETEAKKSMQQEQFQHDKAMEVERASKAVHAARLQKEIEEARHGLKVMLPIYIKGTNAPLSIERQP